MNALNYEFTKALDTLLENEPKVILRYDISTINKKNYKPLETMG